MIEFDGFLHFGAHGDGAELPNQVVGQTAGLGKEILERGPLDVLHLTRAAIAGIEIVLEERAEIDLFEWIFLLNISGGGGAFFDRRVIAFLFASIHVVDQGNGLFQFFENRVLHHFGRDHVPKLKLVEREDADHLDKARGQDLSLRDFET